MLSGLVRVWTVRESSSVVYLTRPVHSYSILLYWLMKYIVSVFFLNLFLLAGSEWEMRRKPEHSDFIQDNILLKFTLILWVRQLIFQMKLETDFSFGRNWVIFSLGICKILPVQSAQCQCKCLIMWFTQGFSNNNTSWSKPVFNYWLIKDVN